MLQRCGLFSQPWEVWQALKAQLVEGRALLLSCLWVQAMPSQTLASPSCSCHSVLTRDVATPPSLVLVLLAVTQGATQGKLYFESGMVAKRGSPACSLVHRGNTAQDQAWSVPGRGPAGTPTPTGTPLQVSEERTVLLQCLPESWAGVAGGLHSTGSRESPALSLNQPVCPAVTDGTWESCLLPSYCCAHRCRDRHDPPVDCGRPSPLSLRQNIN